MVSVSTGDDGTEHDRLVGLVLEVAVPKFIELRSHLLEFLGRWPQLVARIDGVGREACLLWADFPLLEQLLLDLLDTTEEVISSHGVVGHAIDCSNISVGIRVRSRRYSRVKVV